MKANEVPEKIYLVTNENDTHYYTEGIPFEREYSEKGVEAHNALPIISIDAENRMLRHKSITHAAKFFGIRGENIGRCARQNSAMIPNKKNGKVNTNHRYMGIRFYLEDAVHLWSNARRPQE